MKLPEITNHLNRFQEYPPYSSIRVNGKPLWKHLKMELDDIEIPENVKIKNLGIKNTTANQQNLIKLVHTLINLIKNIILDRKIKEEWFKFQIKIYCNYNHAEVSWILCSVLL